MNKKIFILIFLSFSIILNLAQAKQEIGDKIEEALNRIHDFTSQPFTTSDDKKLTAILKDVAYVDELNMKNQATKNAELVDLIYESYLDHQKYYDDAVKKLPKKQKKQLEELFESIKDLEKNGNG